MIGIEIGKDVFDLFGFDGGGKIALRRESRRLALTDAFKSLPRSAGLIAIKVHGSYIRILVME